MVWVQKMPLTSIKTRFDGTIRSSWERLILVHLFTCYHGIYRSNYGYRWPTMGYLPLDRSCSCIWHLPLETVLGFAYKKELTLSTTCKVL